MLAAHDFVLSLPSLRGTLDLRPCTNILALRTAFQRPLLVIDERASLVLRRCSSLPLLRCSMSLSTRRIVPFSPCQEIQGNQSK